LNYEGVPVCKVNADYCREKKVSRQVTVKALFIICSINKRKATDEPFNLHKVIIENGSDDLPLEISLQKISRTIFLTGFRESILISFIEI